MERRRAPDEPTPEQQEEWEEYLQRESRLLEELRSGAISAADYRRLKEEAWDDYQARAGRLEPDENDRGPGTAPPAG